jgi:hypothetical protein
MKVTTVPGPPDCGVTRTRVDPFGGNHGSEVSFGGSGFSTAGGAGGSGVFGVPGVSGVSGISGVPGSGVGSVPGSGWVTPPWGGGSSLSWALATPPRLRAASTTEMARIRASYDAVMGTVLLSCQ